MKEEKRQRETRTKVGLRYYLLTFLSFSLNFISPPPPPPSLLHQRGRLDTDSQTLEGEDLLDDMLTAPSSATLRTDTPTNDDEVCIGR